MAINHLKLALAWGAGALAAAVLRDWWAASLFGAVTAGEVWLWRSTR